MVELATTVVRLLVVPPSMIATGTRSVVWVAQEHGLGVRGDVRICLDLGNVVEDVVPNSRAPFSE